MFQQPHFVTAVRLRTSGLQLFITSKREYLKALIAHGPKHEVTITTNKVLRALSSHCSEWEDEDTWYFCQAAAAVSCLSKHILFTEGPS